MKKTFIKVIALLTLMLMCSSPVFALTINTGRNQSTSTSNSSSTGTESTTEQSTNKVAKSVTTMELVEDKVCEINITDPVSGDTVGNFTKKLTNIDTSKKEATLTLTVKNTNKDQTVTNPISVVKPLEVYFVLDNSKSMDNTYNGKTKIQIMSEIASLFVDSLFENVQNAKVGLVSFSCVEPLGTETDTADFHDGSLEDAKLLLSLSDSKDTIKAKLSEYASTTPGQHTNIEAGLSLAEANFSTDADTNKCIILLSDGVPNLSLNLNKDETLIYSKKIANNTKSKLQDLGNKGYHIYSVLMGLNEADDKIGLTFTPDRTEQITYREYAESIFGTSQAPTTGHFYYIDYATLSTTVNTDIYKDLTEVKEVTTTIPGKPINNLVIKDYFPKEIIDNFNFEYVKSPNIGKVSQSIDTTNNSITWNIEVLKAGEVATLSYKLTLKDNYDKAIVNKILPTNTKVDIDYKYNDVEKSLTSPDSPTIRVKVSESSEDPTVTKKPIPQTGSYAIVIAIAILGIMVFATIKAIQIRKLK